MGYLYNRGLMMYPALKTSRTIIRLFTETDAADVFKLVKIYDEEAVTPQFTNIRTLKDAEKLNEETIKAKTSLMIISKDTQKPIGWTIFDRAMGNKINKRLFVHIWIRSAYQNIEFELELLEKLMHFAFFGIKTEFVVLNAKNSEQEKYRMLSDYGYEIYNRFPKSLKPDDPETTVQFRISRESYKNLAHITEETYDYTPPAEPISPYSYTKPIRKIESIKYIEQPTEYLCGQVVIAMLADVSVNEVINVMKNDKGTGVPLMREALKYYGLKTAKRLKYTEGMALRECCILSLSLPGYGHWSLYYKGKYYDPEFGIMDNLPNQAKLTYIWEIFFQ